MRHYDTARVRRAYAQETARKHDGRIALIDRVGGAQQRDVRAT
jgi:hypothetical protein